MKRNPKMLPERGDLLLKGSIYRTVIYREEGPSMVQVRDNGKIERRPTLKQFRKWASNALVVATREQLMDKDPSA